MIISKTPLRISFCGGGTDLPSFYKNHEYGAVLSTAINKYIYVIVKSHSEIFDEHIRLNYSETERVQSADEIKNPIIRECLRFLSIDDRLFINTIADLPGSSGLGSSSSFCIGLLNALYKYKGDSVSTGRLAEEAAYIELNILKRTMGKQDHYATAYGGMNYFRFYPDETVTIQPIISPRESRFDVLDSLTAFWLNKTRDAADVLKEQDSKHMENAPILTQMRNQANDIKDALCSGDMSVKKFGEFLHSGWMMKKQLAKSISLDWIDELYETALQAGAFGGKIAGAGGGGFLLIVSPPENQSAVRSALSLKGFHGQTFQKDSLGTSVISLS